MRLRCFWIERSQFNRLSVDDQAGRTGALGVVRSKELDNSVNALHSDINNRATHFDHLSHIVDCEVPRVGGTGEQSPLETRMGAWRGRRWRSGIRGS